MEVQAATKKLFAMPLGILMEASFQAFLKLVRKFPWGRNLKPPCRSALVRVELMISI